MNQQLIRAIGLFGLVWLYLGGFIVLSEEQSNHYFSTFKPILYQPPPTPTPHPNCPVPPYPAAAYGQQPYPDEVALYFDQAGLNQLGDNGPPLPLINNETPYIPCILLKAIGYQESGWQHFEASFGDNGYTQIGSSCDYGLMQIVSGMDGSKPSFVPNRVNEEVPYNIGTGALLLLEKWQTLKLEDGGFEGGAYYVGSDDLKVVEDWYYAVWAYNGWGWINNPNNNCPVIPWEPNVCGTQKNPDRPPFDPSNLEIDPRWYPYQELIWGHAAHPPDYNNVFLWQPVDLTLPDWLDVGGIDEPHYPNATLPRPAPYHGSCRNTFLPTVLKRHLVPQDPYEPNNHLEDASPISTGITYTAIIWPATDEDWFQVGVNVPVGKERLVEVWVESIPPQTDYDLEMYDGQGNKIADSRNGGNLAEYIALVTATSQTYYLRVYPFGDGYTQFDSYELQIAVGVAVVPKK